MGGRSVMEKQLERMLFLMREKMITIQIIPYEAGAYAAIDSNFDYLEFDGSVLPDLVFVEGLVSHIYLERLADLERYREALDNLRDAALNFRDSAKRMEDIRHSFASP